MKLAGNRRSHHGVHLVLRVVFAALDHIDHVQNKRLIGNGAEGALINARAARDTFIVIDARLFFIAHRNGFHFARRFARALVIVNRAVRAHFRAGAAFLALRFIDVRHVVFVERNRAETAYVLATVRKATAAGVGYFVTAHRAFVARDIDNFDDVRLIVIQPHGDAHALRQNRAFLINAATHRGNFAGNDGFGDVDRGLRKSARPRFARNFAQNFVL